MTSYSQKSTRKRQRHEVDEHYANGEDNIPSYHQSNPSDRSTDDAVIPTPSIDLVLQNLATNALASTSDALEQDGKKDAEGKDLFLTCKNANKGIVSGSDTTDKEADELHSSEDSTEKKKLRRIHLRARRQRVQKWKINAVQTKQKPSRPRSTQTATKEGSLNRPKTQKGSSACGSSRKRIDMPNNNRNNKSTRETLRMTKSHRTLADLLQYSNVVLANIEGNKAARDSPSTSEIGSSTAEGDPVVHPSSSLSSSKSIATLITDRFRPKTTTFYRYNTTPSVPDVVPRPTTSVILPRSTISPSLNGVDARSMTKMPLSTLSMTIPRHSAYANVTSFWPLPATNSTNPSHQHNLHPECNYGVVSTGLGNSSVGAHKQKKNVGGHVGSPTLETNGVVVIDSDDNEDEMSASEQPSEEQDHETVESAPFCQNCASEIPLILQSLDRLDNMVTSMMSTVKREIMNRRKRIRHDDSNRFTSYQPYLVNMDGSVAASSHSSSLIGGTTNQLPRLNYFCNDILNEQQPTLSTSLPEKILDDDTPPPPLMSIQHKRQQ